MAARDGTEPDEFRRCGADCLPWGFEMFDACDVVAECLRSTCVVADFIAAFGERDLDVLVAVRENHQHLGASAKRPAISITRICCSESNQP
jgi:hypothetical protein